MAGTLKFVLVTILQRNGVQLFDALGRVPLKREIDCENVIVQGVHYFIPQITGGRIDGYTTRMAASDFPPTLTDSIKSLKLFNPMSNETIYIAIANNQDETDFADFCNQCCGSSNDFSVDPATLPEPIIEDETCAVSTGGTGTYTFFAQLPPNPFTNNITLSGFTYNGGHPNSVAFTAGGYADLATLVSWLNTNLGALGTWSADTGKLKLVSTTTSKINLNVDLVPKKYCLTLNNSLTAATQLFVKGADGTTDVIIPISPISAAVANAANVAAALRVVLPDGVITVVPVSSVDHVQYEGLQKPTKLTDGTTNASFAVGAC